MKRIIAIVVGAVGVFFVASGFQHHSNIGANWFGQYCGGDSLCLHPEWIGIGAGLIGLAIYLWQQRGSSAHDTP
jgi:hypothetical protein